MGLYLGNTQLISSAKYDLVEDDWKTFMYNMLIKGEVYIPFYVKYLNEYCFYYASNIKNVVFQENSKLEHIKRYCFYYCQSLTSIDISVCNNLQIIDYRAFSNCSSLTSIEIPSSVISIDNGAFSGCSNLTTITINKPQDSISGAPWGATNATVVWNG